MLPSGNHNGAVSFLPNTFSRDVLVILEQIQSTAPPGEGPLPGPYAQYPFFFAISTYPATPVNQNARVAICYEISGPYSPPASSIGGLRIGHELHTEPATLEVLNRVDVDDLLQCGTVGDETHLRRERRVGWVQKSLGLLADAAGSAVSVLTPKPLYALHVGVGGELLAADEFSDFGIVDPNSGAGECTADCIGAPQKQSSSAARAPHPAAVTKMSSRRVTARAAKLQDR